MRGHPQFSHWIPITLVKIYISFIIINRGKNTFELVGTVLKVPKKRENNFKIEIITIDLLSNRYNRLQARLHVKETVGKRLEYDQLPVPNNFWSFTRVSLTERLLERGYKGHLWGQKNLRGKC